MNSIVLVTGGARSGKSSFAQEMAAVHGDRVAYIATAEARDREMARRIAAHRARRPASWLTIEAPLALAEGISSCRGRAELVIVDCLTVFLSNVLCAEDWETRDAEELWQTVASEMGGVIRAARDLPGLVVFVTNEVGDGIVPQSRLGRVFRDLAGWVNQMAAAAADRVYLVHCGLAVELKAGSVSPAQAIRDLNP